MLIYSLGRLCSNNDMSTDTRDIRRQNLKKLISAYFKDQSDFADKADMDASYLSQMLNGHRNIGEKTARKIEHKLGTDLMSLYNEGFISSFMKFKSGYDLLPETSEHSVNDLVYGDNYLPGRQIKGSLKAEAERIKDQIVEDLSELDAEELAAIRAVSSQFARNHKKH